MKNAALVFRALAILPKKSKKRLYIGASLQSIFALLDILGIAIMGVIGSVGLNYVSGIEMPNWLAKNLESFFGLNYRPTEVLLILSILAAALFTSKSFLSLGISYKIANFLALEQAFASRNFVEKLTTVQYLWLRKQDTQRLIYAATDGVNAIFLGILSNSIIMLSDSILLLLITFTLIIIDPATALMTIILFGTIAFGLQKIIGGYLESQSERITSSAILGRQELDKFFDSYKEVSASRKQSAFLGVFFTQREIYSAAYARNGWAQLIPKYVIEIAMILGASLIIGYQVLFSSASESLTTLLIFISAASRLTPALLRIQSSVLFIRNSSAMANVTFDYLEQFNGLTIRSKPIQSTQTNSISINPVEIELNDISFAFPDDSVNILKDLSLTVSKGEIVAIVGSSGSGKSTLLDLILGILEPTRGSVKINGFPVNAWLDNNPGRVAYVQQQAYIHGGSFLENITLDPVVSDSDIKRLDYVLELTGLNSLRSTYRLDQKLYNLSGGEKQRIAIARAIFAEPSLLVIDEGTSSLDAHAERLISDAILDLRGKSTTLIVAHRLSSIKNADKIVFFSEGSISGIGSFDSVYTTNVSFRELVDAFNV